MICSNTVDWKEAVLRSFKSFVWYPSCIDVKQKEDELTDRLIKQLRWTAVDCTLRGMFGWKEFKTDKKVTHINNKCLNTHFVLEVKKVEEKTEYGYWHGVIQTLLYRHLLTKYPPSTESRNLPILCVVVDWGRACWRLLCCREIGFLYKYLKHENIFFVRIAFHGNLIRLEHNLSCDDKWCRSMYDRCACKWIDNYYSPYP
jgi:hypothetical protein